MFLVSSGEDAFLSFFGGYLESCPLPLSLNRKHIALGSTCDYDRIGPEGNWMFPTWLRGLASLA